MAQRATPSATALPSLAAAYLAGQSVTVGSGGTSRTLDGADILSVNGRYGINAGAPDSIYVSCLTYAALGKHRYSTNNRGCQWILDLQNLQSGTQGYGSFGNSPRHTAAALIHLPVDPTARDAARAYLTTLQLANGSWQDDPLLTALCLQALTLPQVLYVHSGDAGDQPHDSAMQQLFQARGFAVTTVLDEDPAPSDLSAFAMIFISGSADPVQVSGKYAQAVVPVVVAQGALYDEMFMAVSGSGGTVSSQTSITIRNSGGHPLGSGLSPGTHSVQASGAINWAVVNSNAIVAATRVGVSSHAVIFAYPTDTLMPGGINAPAPRIGVFVNKNGGVLTDKGRDLVDALIRWSCGKEVAK